MKKIRLPHFLASIVLLIAAVVFVLLLQTAWKGNNNPRELPADVSLLVSRTAEVTGTAEAQEIWLAELQSGRISVHDFTRICFTGTDYLLQGKDDMVFAKDLSYAIWGTAEQADRIADMLKDNSRIFVIESVLYSVYADYAPDFSEDKDHTGTRVLAVELGSPIQDSEGYAFGVRKSVGSITIAGDHARTDFYIDGNLRAGQMSLSEQEGDTKTFSLIWDTRRELSGKHSVLALLRTSDGRGTILTGGEVVVPEFYTLINDGVQLGSLPEGDKEVWYALDAQERNAYINFVDATGDVAVALYDMYGEPVGKNDLPGVGVEVLRGKKQELSNVDASDPYLDPYTNTFYIRVGKGQEEVSAGAIEYLMIQSKEVAVDSSGQYYAVISDIGSVPTPYPTAAVSEDVSGAMVDLRDFNFKPVSIKRSELSFLPINGCLHSLSFFSPNEEEALPAYPKFATETQAYAYVAQSSIEDIRAEILTIEGYASSVEIVNETEDGVLPVTADLIPVRPSRNVIKIKVSDFDGVVHEYPLYLLSGSDTQKYDQEILYQFPSSYRNGLWLMHNLQPSYRFQPYDTGISWTEMLDAQDHKDRSLISDYYSPGWVEEGSPVYDGSSWRAAKREVISYFMDPRNFFDPVFLFQYEKLSYDPNIHTIDGVRSMVKGSFLEESDPDYASILLQAGLEANISPYFLTSRIIQEMGRNGESLLAFGTLPEHEGFYNFYNIGSTPNPDVKNGALINGAKYAQWGSDPSGKTITDEEAALLLPWTTPDLAIRGGALWIAKSYVDIGQNTLYFQKFDVIPNEDGLYKHQYAQNIQMAYSESTRYYRAYLSQNMINDPFLFAIPVYDDMPEQYGFLPVE